MMVRLSACRMNDCLLVLCCERQHGEDQTRDGVRDLMRQDQALPLLLSSMVIPKGDEQANEGDTDSECCCQRLEDQIGRPSQHDNCGGKHAQDKHWCGNRGLWPSVSLVTLLLSCPPSLAKPHDVQPQAGQTKGAEQTKGIHVP